MRVAKLLALASLVASPAISAGGSFFDDFRTLDESRWYVAEFAAFADWMNCAYLRRNVAVRDGVLQLTFDEQPAFNRDYACASISTHKRYSHGTYEARFRVEAASGLNMNFFSYIGPHYNAPHDEIDFEVITRDPSQVEVTAWVEGESLYGKKLPLDPPADAAFHTYSFIWEPERIRWYVDGVLLHETDDPARQPKAAQHIFLSVWGTETLVDWMGPFDATGLPKGMEVDWVSYTAPGESCLHEGSILCDPDL